jgi:uncharacterized iron-regulated membrane protein
VRRLWLVLHRYVGLTIAAALLLVTLSGAVLVFEDDLDRALTPQLSFVAVGGTALPVGTLVARARAAAPSMQLGAVSFPERPDHSLQISARTPTEPSTIYLDPYTGAVLGMRSASAREAGLARRIHVLHTRLFAGEIGEWIVGVITALTLFMAVTGLVLWWPRKIIGVKTTASWRRITFDLHNVFGVYASAVFLFIALTGMMISFERITDPLLTTLNDSSWPEAPRRSPVPSRQALPIDTLAERARAALPGAFLKSLGLPDAKSGMVVAGMKYPEDRTPGGRSRVFLDPYSGEPLAVWNTRAAPLGTRIINLKRSAHTGDIFGGLTRAVYFVTAVMLAGQILTGVFIWGNRRRLGGA